MTRRQRLARKALGDALPGYDDVDGLPLNLNNVARSLGVGDIRYMANELHGFTDWASKRPTIYLSMAKTDGRRRFILGHECGHLVLGEDGAANIGAYRPGDDLDDETEKLCDAIAGELLVPSTWLDAYAPRVRDLATISAAASHLRVSLSTMVVRLRSAGLDAALLTLVATRSNEWMVASRIGVGPQWHGRLRLGAETTLALNRLADEPTDFHGLRFAASNAAGQSLDHRGTVRVFGRTATVYLPNAGLIGGDGRDVGQDRASETGVQPADSAHRPGLTR